jgi:hypothetical protein
VDRLILVGQRFGESRQIGLVTVVVLIEHYRRDVPGDSRHETSLKRLPIRLSLAASSLISTVYILDIGQRGWRVATRAGAENVFPSAEHSLGSRFDPVTADAWTRRQSHIGSGKHSLKSDARLFPVIPQSTPASTCLSITCVVAIST